MVWALVAASALFWALRLFIVPAPVPARTTVASSAPPIGGDLSRLFGGDAAPPSPEAVAQTPAESRFQLIGVVAAQPRAAAREGVALIAVDGRAAKAFRVGAVVEGQTILTAVAARGATLGTRDGASPLNLVLSPLAPPATGTLPGVDGADPGFQPPPAPAAFPLPGAGKSARPVMQPMGPQTPQQFLPPTVRRLLPPQVQPLEAPPQQINNLPTSLPTS